MRRLNKQQASQLNNFETTAMYIRQCMTLAENVFRFKNLPDYIDVSYVNKILIRDGAIAFFYEDVLDELIALPFVANGKIDIYGRPLGITCQASNGATYNLKPGEYVIMYDNNGRYPLYVDIVQYANRLALDTRVEDINIAHQKTPRFWMTSSDKEMTIKNIVNNVDSFNETVIAYDGNLADQTNLVLQPAPFVADKVEDHRKQIWNEFLRLIGVTNMTYQKRERVIKDEVSTSQGGTIASRFNRFEPRERAIEQINNKWNLNIEVEYYDGLPTTLVEEDSEDFYDDVENGGGENDI